MGLLNRFFESPENLARDIKLDEDEILKVWDDYLDSFEKKSDAISNLSSDNYTLHIRKIKDLLDLEIVDISEEEKDEKDVVRNLSAIEYLKKIRKIKTLKDSLGYAQTRYEHAYELLKGIYSILKSEMHLLKKISQSSRSVIRLIDILKSQLKLEGEIISQIEQIDKFGQLFLGLMTGERLINEIDVQRKKITSRVYDAFRGIIDEPVLSQSIELVMDAIEDKIHEEISGELIPELGFSVSADFVNSKEFVDMVKACFSKLNAQIADEIVSDFIEEFRKGLSELSLGAKS